MIRKGWLNSRILYVVFILITFSGKNKLCAQIKIKDSVILKHVEYSKYFDKIKKDYIENREITDSLTYFIISSANRKIKVIGIEKNELYYYLDDVCCKVNNILLTQNAVRLLRLKRLPHREKLYFFKPTESYLPYPPPLSDHLIYIYQITKGKLDLISVTTGDGILEVIEK